MAGASPPGAPPAGASAIASDAAIAQLARNAGFAASVVAIAVAVALAESSGECWAVSSSGDYGLMQINYAAHKDLFAAIPNATGWAEPDTNMRMAVSVYNAGGGFGPWTTYTGGAYSQYLARGQKAAAAPSSQDATKVLTLVSGQMVAGGVHQVGQGLPSAPTTAPLVRVLEVVLGAGLLWLGLDRLARPVTAPIASAASKAAKGAAVLAA